MAGDKPVSLLTCKRCGQPPVKVHGRFKVGGLCQFYRAPNLDYRVQLWVDLYGDSYHGMPDTPARRKWLARKLREAAKWVETVK